MDIMPTTALGRITKSYGDGFYAIKPLGKIKGVELEPIPRVPMCQLGNIDFTQIMPFKVGDVVPIAFLSYSQSNYLENDDDNDLDSDITNNLVDCIAYPFIVPTASNKIIEEIITIKGNSKQNGIADTVDVKASGISLAKHAHDKVANGNGVTGGPV